MTMLLVWRSNWIVMLQCLLRGFVVGAVMEAGAQALMYAGVLRTFHGFMLVFWWCIDASYTYAARRDPVDGVRGLVVAGATLASFFAGTMWLSLFLQGRVVPWLSCWMFGFSLLVSGSTAMVRRFKNRAYRR